MSYDSDKFNYFKDFNFSFFLLPDILQNLSTQVVGDFIKSVGNIWCQTDGSFHPWVAVQSLFFGRYWSHLGKYLSLRSVMWLYLDHFD